MNIIIFAYVGKPVQSMKDIYLSYNSAKTVLQNNKPFTSHSAVCSINDSIEKNISFIYPPSTENRLIEYVLNGNREKVHSMISDIVNFEGALMSKEQFSLIVVLFNSLLTAFSFY